MAAPKRRSPPPAAKLTHTTFVRFAPEEVAALDSVDSERNVEAVVVNNPCHENDSSISPTFHTISDISPAARLATRSRRGFGRCVSERTRKVHSQAARSGHASCANWCTSQSPSVTYISRTLSSKVQSTMNSTSPRALVWCGMVTKNDWFVGLARD